MWVKHMTEEFKKFIDDLLKAFKEEDLDFLRPIYKEWFESSGFADQASFEDVAKEFKALAGLKVDNIEEYDGFFIAHAKDPDDPETTNDLVFRKEETWTYINPFSNRKSFKNIYAISYHAEGGTARVIFNSKRSPFIEDATNTTKLNSMINASLKPGDNEVTLEPVEGAPEVKLLISSAKEGDVVNTGEGDILNWSGKLDKKVTLKFKVE